MFESVYGTVILNIQKPLEKSSSWFINSVVDQTIDITKHKPLNGGSYLKLPKELNNPKKDWISIQNIDNNKWFKWSLIRYLHLGDQNPGRIRKVDKDFSKELDSKDIKVPAKIKDTHKIEKIKWLYGY